MKRIVTCTAIICSFFLATFHPQLLFGADATPPASTVKLVFIHHSTGGHWLADSNADNPYGELGTALKNNNYFVSATNYCWGPGEIGSRTDIVNWLEWFTGSERDTVMSALYIETGPNFADCDDNSFGSWTRLADPGGENAVVLFKSCFPNSNLYGNPDDPPAASPNNWEFSVGNAKAIYNDILAYFATRQDKLFVVVTAPPMTEAEYCEDPLSKAQRAANARAFNDWLDDDWLDGYSHHNVAVFDYFNVLTHPENHHRVVEGVVEHTTSPLSGNFAYYPSGDSHPDTEGQQKATLEFAPLLNVFYNNWRSGAPAVSKPTSTTGAASAVGTDSAALNGVVVPNGAETSYHFVYGRTTEYGTATTPAQAGSGTAGVAVDAAVTGLDAATEYHFRLVAQNSQGTTLGGDSTFSTSSVPVVFGNVDGSANGRVDLGDAIVSLWSSAGKTVDGLVVAAEVDGDGRVGLGETDYALKVVAGLPYSPPASQRLQPGDFQYVGAFRLPDEFNWGGRGISFYPAGDGGSGSLLVTGFELLYDPAHPGESCWDSNWDCYAHFGEVRIPAPVSSSNWESLPVATMPNPLRSYDGGLASGVHREWVFVDGIQYVPRRGTQSSDKIYGSISAWYAEGAFGEDTFPTVWFAELDGTNAKGMFQVGPDQNPFHGRKMGSYLFAVPSWYADRYLGGRTLVTGRSRGTPLAGGEVTTDGGSQGPTLFAFPPFDSDSPSGNLDALPMLYYRVKFPACAGPNVGDPAQCDYPNFTMCDEWTGGAFVEKGAKNAIMLLGYKGLGNNCYDSEEPPVDCDDPCSEYHGYHCNPYERQIIFYDTTQLGESALGRREPWTVLPYAIWRPEEFFLEGNVCWNAGGMAFDEAGKRIFMVERGFGDGEMNACVVHVWSVQ